MEKIEKVITNTAYNNLGQEEIRGNLGFKDSDFEKKLIACGWVKGQAWCAYFAELVWRESYAHFNSIVENDLRYIFSGSAVNTFNNFKESGAFELSNKPSIGSLVVWQYYKKGVKTWMGHVGIVTKVLPDGSFYSIEGNTNDDGSREGYKVALRHRSAEGSANMKILGFVKPSKP